MSDENKLANLEFFDTFGSDEPIDSLSDLGEDNPDPNQNIAPDILNGEDFDPLKDNEDDDDLPKPKDKPAPPVEDTDSDDQDDTDDDDTQGDDDDDDDQPANDFEIFAKGLAKAGVLTLDENEDIEWNEETFIGAMQETIEARAWTQLEEMALETYGDAGVKLIEDIFINKVPVAQYLQMFNNESIVENVDLSSEENQESVFRLYLEKTGLDADEIEDQLTYARDNDRLAAYAEKYHAKLLDKMQEERERLSEESKARVADIQRREEEREQTYASVLNESIKTGEIEGYPINEKSADELFSFVLDKPHQLPNGQRITDFEYKLAKMRQEDPKKFLAVARLVQNDLDLTPVKRKAVTEETNTLFKGLKNKTKVSGKSSRQPKDFTRYFS